MRRLKRSFWAKTAVAVASIAIAIGVIGGISFASNNQPFLGDCIEYGIVCNYLNQTADMETNFAVGKYTRGMVIGMETRFPRAKQMLPEKFGLGKLWESRNSVGRLM